MGNKTDFVKINIDEKDRQANFKNAFNEITNVCQLHKLNAQELWTLSSHLQLLVINVRGVETNDKNI